MKADVNKTRNFVVAGHSGSGKTSLCDLMLFKAGAVDRLGRPDQKTSVSDYTPDEQEKASSIYSSVLNCEWNNNQFYFIDTPGYGEFIGETIASLAATGNVLLVIDGVNGIEVGATRAWKLAKQREMPRFIFINTLDREMADFANVLDQLQEAYGKTLCVPLTMPVGKGDALSSVIHVLKSNDIPADLTDEVASYKEQLMDTIAESDEELMMRYLDGEELSEEEIAKGLSEAILSGDLVPVFAGSVEKDVGIDELMNGISNLFATPLVSKSIVLKNDEVMAPSADGPGVAQVFKSIVDPFIGQLTYFRVLSGTFKSDSEVYNVTKGNKERFGTIQLMNGKNQVAVDEVGPGAIAAIAKLKSVSINDTLSTNSKAEEVKDIVFPNTVMSYAVTATKSGEEEKIASGLIKLSHSDLTIKLERHNETHELLLSGMGDQHLGNAVKKLKETAKVDVNLASPKIPYRETITSIGKAQYRHKKQSGGSGQFAEAHLRIEPNEAGYEFVNEVVGGNIPKNFIPAVEKGVVEAMQKGPLVGCVVENIKVAVYDGKHHPVDSNEMAFKIAGRTAFRNAMADAKPIILEPIQSVKITIPDEYMGDITGDLNQKRGRVLGMAVEDGMQVVSADVPLAEMSRYATELRSMTQGRGTFEMEFGRYEMVPSNVAKEIIEAHKAEEEAE